MKVFELKISEDDEDISGVSKLSIVKSPATQMSWEVFNEQEFHDCHFHEDLSDKALEVFDKYGMEVSRETFANATFQEFAVPPIISNPRLPSFGDANDDTATSISRYIYVVDTGLGAPLIKKSRELCRKLILAQRVYSRTDLQNLSNEISAMGQESFKLVFRPRTATNVDLFEYKAGKSCRHKWTQIDFPIGTNETYEQALQKIPLKANQATSKGKVIEGSDRPFQSEARYLGMSSQNPNHPIGLHFGVLLYSSRFAALMAEPTAKIITKVKCGTMEGYAPIDILDEYFEGTAQVIDKFAVKQTFAEVPQYIRDAAKRAVDWTDENGWGDCSTDVGKRRANDLADPNYNISLDVISRMYSYGSRHKQDWEASKSIEDGCGYLSLLSWGFSPDNYDQAMSWLERQMKNSTENMKFSSDEYKGDITSVVFEPDTYIYRWDGMKQEPYYVFMSKDTIRQMLMKLSRLKEMGKLTNIINYEHSGIVFNASDVFTYENWIVGEDPKKDKSYEIFGREMKPGTWITTIHFKNRKLFDDFILSNKTTGVSLEGMFMEIPFNFMKEEDFIEPGPGQSQDDYISECIPFMIKEGYDQEQAAAICYSKWENKFNFPEDTCWTGYEPYGTKIVDGREVPNCVPVKAGIDTKGMGDYLDPNDDELEVKIEVDFAPYDWDKCIADQTEAYGSKEIAQKVCGKIRSENMAMLGIIEGAPVYPTKDEADQKATELGCSGSHYMEGYGYSPCMSHDEASKLYNAEVLVYLLEEMLKQMD